MTARETLIERRSRASFCSCSSSPASAACLALAWLLGADDALFAKYGTLVGAYTGLALFLVLLSVQAAG